MIEAGGFRPGSCRRPAELAGGEQKEERDGSSGFTFPQGVCRLYLGLLSISHCLVHGKQGQNEPVSLNGKVWASDKAGGPHMGREGNARMSPKVFVSRSFPKKSSEPGGFRLPVTGWPW